MLSAEFDAIYPAVTQEMPTDAFGATAVTA